VKDVLKEVVDFHGGKINFQRIARKRSERFIKGLEKPLLSHKRKLQDNPDPKKIEKYQKYGTLLDARGYRFPTDLLSNFGSRYLLEKINDKTGMRAWEIPNIIEDALLMRIEEKDKNIFEVARKLRNKLAHGVPQTVPLAEALQHASELHTFAAKIDHHICEHFFVIQAV